EPMVRYVTVPAIPLQEHEHCDLPVVDRNPGTARVRLGSAGGRQRTQRCLSGFWNLHARLSDAMGPRAGQPRGPIQSRALQELQAHGAHEVAVSLRSLQCPESSEVRRSGDQPREFELRACTAVATEQRPSHSDGREINVLRNYAIEQLELART